MDIYNDKEYKLFVLKIGLRVSYYRKLAGLSQEELSTICGMSLNFVSTLEAPSIYYTPSFKSMFKISKALGVPVSKLVEVDND